MPRNQEVIRQWKLLHALNRRDMVPPSRHCRKSSRSPPAYIRRDLAALQEAGFALYDERDEDGHVKWRLDGQVLKGIDTGFTLSELCALYLSRNLRKPSPEPLSARSDERVRAAREATVTADAAVPRSSADVLVAKPGPRARGGASSTGHRGASARSHTAFSRDVHALPLRVERTDQGLPRPSHRLAFAQGQPPAYVPEYKAVRTFAVDRIASASLEKQTFTVTQAWVRMCSPIHWCKHRTGRASRD